MENRYRILVEGALSGFAHVANHKSQQWFNAHFPAAVLAGVSILTEFTDLTDDCSAGIERSIHHVIDTHQEFFACSLFDDDQFETIAPDVACSRLEQALLDNARCLTSSGHGVIFGTLGIKFILALGKPVPSNIIEALETIIAWTEEDNPKRYYGVADYKAQAVALGEAASVHDVDAAIDVILANQDCVFPDQSIAGEHYFFTGDKLHELTHAQALHWLNQLGYTQLASAGLENLKQQLVLNRQAPDKGECHRLQVYLDPFMEAFWTRPFSDPHHIKLAGAVMEFSRRRNPRQAAGFLKDVAVYWELLP